MAEILEAVRRNDLRIYLGVTRRSDHLVVAAVIEAEGHNEFIDLITKG
jgi:hypothetical protein